MISLLVLPTLDQLSTLPSMAAAAFLFAAFWAFTFEFSEKKISQNLNGTTWWSNASRPIKSMMLDQKYPDEPTERFPEGTTDLMVRNFYASYTINAGISHSLCSFLMLPLLMHGWDEASETMKVIFVLGSLADVGWDIYDSIRSTVRAFARNHTSPIPVESWFLLVCLHHSLAMALVIPMNLRYVHRHEFHQLSVALLLGGTMCLITNAYKYTLDVYKKKTDFFLYKLIVLFQLAVILYTRMYMWFIPAFGLRAHIQEQGDTTFFRGATVMITIFSLFNVLFAIDAIGAAVKWLPRKFPKSEEDKVETEELVRRTSGVGAIAPTAQMLRMTESKRKVKASVNVAIAVNRLQSIGEEDSTSATKKKD